MYSNKLASAPNAKGKIITVNRLIFAAFFILTMLLGNIAFLYQSVERQLSFQAIVDHTMLVISGTEEVNALTKDLETGMRGFVITAQEPFLEPYETAKTRVFESLRYIFDLTSDNPEHRRKIEELRQRVETLVAWQSNVIDQVRRNSREAGREQVLSGSGKLQMDGIRSLIREIKDGESKLLDARRIETTSSAKNLSLSIFIVAVVNVVLVLLAYQFIRRFLVSQDLEEERLASENWFKTGLASLGESLRGDVATEVVGERALNFFAQYVGAQVGGIYTLRVDVLELSAVYARKGTENQVPLRMKLSESLAGEAVRRGQTIELRDVPGNYVKVGSVLGESQARSVVIVPIAFDGQTIGIIELGFLGPVSREVIALLEACRESVGVAISSAENRVKLQALLEETQRQSEELVVQQEELRTSNEELESQASILRSSQEQMQVQQEELRQTNEELEQQTRALDVQNEILVRRNDELNEVRESLEQKADELARASRYKSEFLSNMSHELRTPLNSLLILATLLAENQEKNLTQKQIEFAKTIFKAGNDLLALISDILDLSKVEAGKVDLCVESIDMPSLTRSLEKDFRHLADEKKIAFRIQFDEGVQLMTDELRLQQILKNLISNAIKFTNHGEVSVEIERGTGRLPVVFKIKDTGIGIAPEKQGVIFEAFEQADGSTSRAYGGTGLGLTISRELATLLNGTIEVSSVVGKGSVFTLRLPRELQVEAIATSKRRPMVAPFEAELVKSRVVESPRADIVEAPPMQASNVSVAKESLVELMPGDRLVLVVEDDPDFGGILVEVAREAGFKATLASSGEEALSIAMRYPVAAVLLDIKLPDMSGLSVLERLKGSPTTRHVPIHIVSGSDYAQNALKLGAVGYLVKPAGRDQLTAIFSRIENILARTVKRVLVVEDDRMQRQAIKELLGHGDVEIDGAESGAEALQKVKAWTYDCIVLDLRLPDMSGFELLQAFDKALPGAMPPVVVYTGKDLSHEEKEQLERYAETIILKGARSPERLLDEVSLFLHRVETSLPSTSQALLQKLRTEEKGLKDRRILVVDDDMRNVFALVNALEASGVKSVVARNGKEALEQLEKDSGIELVLLDIMMPVMDGFEAMARIRSNYIWKKLPIIALTAKAMKGDQEECIRAGANDYLPKPVSLERLLSLLKVWLPQRM